MLKTSPCLPESISVHFACRPLRATSVQVTAALASYPVSPRRPSKLRRGLPYPGFLILENPLGRCVVQQRNKSDGEGSQLGTKATRHRFSLTEIKRNRGRSFVKKIVLASACILALALPAAAQNAQPSDGASSQGNVGPDASQGTMKNETGTMNKGTTGASSRPSPGGDASTSGASTAAGTHNTGSATTPDAVQKGVNKQ